MACDGRCLECKLPDCNEKRRVYSEKSRYKFRSEEARQHQKDLQKKRRAKAKENGLCIVCTKKKATHGTKCYECYIRQKRLDKKYHNQGKRDLWKEEGRCYFCGKPAVSGKGTCTLHLLKLRDNAKRLNTSTETKRARNEMKRWLWEQ